MSSATRKQKRLAIALTAGLGLLGLQTAALASILSVTSCADDGSAGTLRQVAAGALSGDTIDLGALSCVNSTISLTQGEIVLPYNASVTGPAGGMTLNASGSRVFHSTSQDTPSAYLKLSNLTLTGSVSGSVDTAGGCILASGTVTLTNSSVSGCSANSTSGAARGGGIYAASVQLYSSRVSGNSANAPAQGPVARGGGIYVTGGLYCKDSTISGNTAVAASGSTMASGGGAMLANAALHLNRCTVDGNSADYGAGVQQMVFYGPHNQSLIESSTISGNTAGSAYAAGGVDVFCLDCVPAPVTLYNSTVALNSNKGTFGAGIYTNGTITAQSTIVAKNVGTGGVGADTFATQFSGANNLVMVANGTVDAGAITSNADPLLLPLADNGGATRTHALGASSPALTTGNNVKGYATDQRGGSFVRVVNALIDIGAFQTQAGSTPRAASDELFAATFDQ